MKKQIVSVIGLGYVGLPTACVIANCKNKKYQNIFEVNGIDKNLNELKTNILESKFFSKILSEDKNLNKILFQSVRNNKINFSKNIESIHRSDIVIVSINFDFKKLHIQEHTTVFSLHSILLENASSLSWHPKSDRCYFVDLTTQIEQLRVQETYI